ncbi:MAG: cupredoxin domain-containing protein [Gemmatimonadota bacterium]
MQTRSTTLLSLSLLVLFSGCERQETADTLSDTAAIHPEVVPPAVTGDTAAAADTIHVVLREWSVNPARDTLDAGRILFHVMNEGQYEHALEVEGGGIEEETDHIQPGQTATLEVNLQPGTYELYCPVEDTHGKHEELGMRTTVVVR